MKKTMTYAEFIGYVPANPRAAAFMVLEPHMQSKVEVREWNRRRDMIKYIEEHEKVSYHGEWRQRWIAYTSK